MGMVDVECELEQEEPSLTIIQESQGSFRVPCMSIDYGVIDQYSETECKSAVNYTALWKSSSDLIAAAYIRHCISE